MTPPGQVNSGPGIVAGTFPRAPGVTSLLVGPTYESLPGVPGSAAQWATRPPPVKRVQAYPCPCGDRRIPAVISPGTREDGVEQATLTRRGTDDPRLSEDELRLLAQIATGVTADVAARKLELSARTLRRRLRSICDRLNVNTPIEAVVWAARRQLI
jgi:DNA-binding CsgD family transcriptional regulator